MQKTKLKVQLDGRDGSVPLGGLLRVMESTLQILNGLDAVARGGSARHAGWHVSDASLNSPMLLELTEVGSRDDARGPSVFRGAVEGLRILDREASTPPNFDNRMLQAAKMMVSVLSDGIASLTFGADDVVAAPTQRVAAHVDHLTRPYEAVGTFEGELEAVHAHASQRFYIYERLSGTKIPCTFKDEHRPILKKALFERVLVSGHARFGPEGRALSLDVDTILIAPKDDELPDFFRVPPIDITHGVDPADYIEGLRNGEE